MAAPPALTAVTRSRRRRPRSVSATTRVVALPAVAVQASSDRSRHANHAAATVTAAPWPAVAGTVAVSVSPTRALPVTSGSASSSGTPGTTGGDRRDVPVAVPAAFATSASTSSVRPRSSGPGT